MKRLRVILNRDPLVRESMYGGAAKLVDADSGQELGCVTDFNINVPLDGMITVNAKMLVHDIVVAPPYDNEESRQRLIKAMTGRST